MKKKIENASSQGESFDVDRDAPGDHPIGEERGQSKHVDNHVLLEDEAVRGGERDIAQEHEDELCPNEDRAQGDRHGERTQGKRNPLRNRKRAGGKRPIAFAPMLTVRRKVDEVVQDVNRRGAKGEREEGHDGLKDQAEIRVLVREVKRNEEQNVLGPLVRPELDSADDSCRRSCFFSSFFRLFFSSNLACRLASSLACFRAAFLAALRSCLRLCFAVLLSSLLLLLPLLSASEKSRLMARPSPSLTVAALGS